MFPWLLFLHRETIFIVYTSPAFNVYSMASVSHWNRKAYHTNLFIEVNVLINSPYDNFLYFLYFLKLWMFQKFKNKIPHHHLQQISIILMWGIGSLAFKYTCFVHRLLYINYLNPTPSNSTVHQTSVPDVNWPAVLCSMLLSKTNLYVFYFCKVALKQQKHLKANFSLSEIQNIITLCGQI